MMRLVTSPLRHYHFGRRQEGFHDAVTSACLTPAKINWTFSQSLNKQRSKRNNNEHDHKLPSSSWEECLDRRSKYHFTPSCSFPVPACPSFSFSSSPLVPSHILPSRRVFTTAGAVLIQQTKSLASLHPSMKIAVPNIGESTRFFHSWIVHSKVHSSSKVTLNTNNRALFSGAGTLAPAQFRHYHLSAEKDSEFFHISSEVRQALAENVPVVALESAIITHGMPFPDNIDTALRLETIIREQGVVPATTGVVRGRLTVGLSQNEIETLGRWVSKGSTAPGSGAVTTHHYPMDPVVKVSRRDFPFALAHKLSGGTTVSGTIIAAVKAGISVFATGGLGGVHRGAETTFDVSADLKELGRNSICVVSAGVKSILDIGKTLEYMETEGICVVVLKKETEGRKLRDEDHREKKRVEKQIGTAKFPSFFTAESSFTAPYAVQSEMEAAALIHSAFQLQLKSGVLIAVPIPEEEGNKTGREIEEAIQRALELAERNGVQGRDLTPFLLSQVNRLTGGLSLKANKHLIENNVRSASGIAIRLAQLRRQTGNSRGSCQEKRSDCTLVPGSQPICPRKPQGNSYKDDHRSGLLDPELLTRPGESDREKGESSPITAPRQRSRHKRPVVIGGTSLDLVLAIEEDQVVRDGRTHRTQIRTALGGVARNMAEALKKLQQDPILLSAFGTDLFGREIVSLLTQLDMDHSKMLASRSSPTAVYAALLNSQGECLLGMGDMTVHEEIGREYITQSKTLLEDAPIVILDANLSLDGISSILEICHGSGTPVWFEPTEIRKAEKICQVASPESLAAVSYMSPNLNELKSIVGAAPVTKSGVTPFDEISRDELSAEEQVALQNCFSMFPGLKMVLLTKGKQGIIVAFKDQEKDILGIFKLPSPSINSSDIVSVSGAGDCLNAGFISGILRGLSWNECARLGSDCAKQSLLTISNVPDKFV